MLIWELGPIAPSSPSPLTSSASIDFHSPHAAANDLLDAEHFLHACMASGSGS